MPRRSWAVWTVVCATALHGCGARPAQSLTGSALTDKVQLLPGEQGNLVLLDATEARLLVDSGISPQKGLAPGLRFLVHCHPQEAASPLPPGVTRVCHQKALHPNAEQTSVAFRSTLDLTLGKLEVHCYHKGVAFTDGDCQVYFPDDQVLIVGDLVQPGRHAAVDLEGRTDLRSWARVLRDLHEDFHDAEQLQIVPARGKPGPIQLLLDQADYLEQVLDFASAAHRHGLTLSEWLADSTSLEKHWPNRTGKPGRALLVLAYETTKR
jgi:hypothetical protein